MNTDTLLHTSQFMPLKDKMTLASTSQELYAHSRHIYKDVIVEVTDDNLDWVEKYTPKLIVKYLKYINLSNICQLILRDSLLPTLPDLSTLKHLQIFDVSSTSLTELPESIGQCKQLRTINRAH